MEKCVTNIGKGGKHMGEIEQLYNEYKLDVYNYLLWLTRDSSLSEDLLQETFVKAITSINRFKGDSSLRTWLFSISRHLWLQNIRKKKIYINIDSIPELPFFDDIDQRIIDNEAMARLNELMAQRDNRSQDIVRMRSQGYSYAEISETLGVSESTARVIDFRIKKWLKDELKKEGFI
jgi:RNA polymerase sigma factor (sigma-70 family)